MLALPRTSGTGPAEMHVLFAQARRRRRQRRLAVVLASIAAAAVIAAGINLAWPQQSHPAAGARHAVRPAVAARPEVSVAWVDYLGRLHVGDLRTLAQRVVAHTTAYPVTPLVQADGGIYWVDTGGEYATVRALDPATGTVADLGFGQSVFASADGRHVFIAQTGTSVTELPAGRLHARGKALTLPHGWYLPGGESLATAPAEVAGGITVQSAPEASAGRSKQFAVWNPDTGKLRTLGTGFQYISAASGPRDRGILAVRLCLIPGACPIKIISTSAPSGVTVRSPLPYGFALGGSFSPGGTRLAVFINTGSEANQPAPVQLALVNTRTGVLRLVRGARFAIGEDIAWIRWLPGGKELIAGGLAASYLVNPVNLAVRPLYFVRGSDHYIEDSQDINYTAVILQGSVTR